MFKYKLLIFINYMVVWFFIGFGSTEVSRFSDMYLGLVFLLQLLQLKGIFEGGKRTSLPHHLYCSFR